MKDKGSHVEAFGELGPNKLTDRTCTVGVRAVATRTKVKRARAAAQSSQSEKSSSSNCGKHSKRSAHLDDFAVTLWPIDRGRGRGRLSMSPLLGQMNELDGVAHWTHHSISKLSFLAAIIPLNAFPTLGRGRVRRGQGSNCEAHFWALPAILAASSIRSNRSTEQNCLCTASDDLWKSQCRRLTAY